VNGAMVEEKADRLPGLCLLVPQGWPKPYLQAQWGILSGSAFVLLLMNRGAGAWFIPGSGTLRS